MKNINILIVDDNKSILSALELHLKKDCNSLKTLSNPNLLLNELSQQNYHVVLLDMNFTAGINSGNEGLYWLERIKEFDQTISVIMITAYGDVELAVRAVRKGAFDFILKPWENQKLSSTIKSALALCLSKREVSKLKQKEKQLIAEINRYDKSIIGSSVAIRSVLDMVSKVAVTDANVFITGENGTGKELVAQEIHRLSKRAEEVMVSVDMGAISETLFESELFGHKKGSFTDANSDRTGKIETANKGTLFLDEIGNLSLPLQSKLLTVLQNRTITRVGDNMPLKVDVRLICATNCDLHDMVDKGTFREDLLYRINTIRLEVPPLRDRGKDVLELAGFFLNKYASKYGKSDVSLSVDAKKQLSAYTWPGNIRELQHAIEKAIILTDHKVLHPADFNLRSTGENQGSLEGTLEEMELKLISAALKNNEGNYSSAASKLGISRQTLYNKIRKYGL